MARTKISEFSPTPGSNTDIDGINIAENCPPSGINDAIRELMAQLKDFQAGTAGDSFNGPIGSTTAVTGAFTNITASGTLGVTGVATLGNGAVLGTPASVTLTNGTGLPIATGVSGLGTGVATALAVNVGSAGAPVLFNGALGTPASGTVTNLTGTASININGTVGATTANTGAFTTLSASSTVTLSGGTANGVAYLNASKELTTGSALTFDGTNLGIGASPTFYGGQVATAGSIAITGGSLLKLWNTGGTGVGGISSPGTDTLSFSVGSGFSEQMRLTSTGLGIGTSSPDQKLTIQTATANQGVSIYNTTGAGGYGGSVTFGIQAGLSLAQHGQIYTSLTNGGPGTVAADMVFKQAISGSLTEFMRASSGNLGLGVTPSAWGTYRAMQIGSAGVSLMGGSAGVASFASVGNNFYFDGSSFRYVVSAAAGRQNFANGAIVWYTAPSGTAGDAISFSQVMTLDASGNLVVGGTTAFAKMHGIASSAGNTTYALMTDNAAAGAGVNVAGLAFANSGSIKSSITSAVYGNDYMAFNVGSNTERARIDSSGNLIQTVNTTAATLATNNTLTFSIVDNSTLRISVRGSDGTTRTATVALT